MKKSSPVKLLLSVLFLMLINGSFGYSQGDDGTERIRPWPDNPHYLAWGDTPVFLIGPVGYHA